MDFLISHKREIAVQIEGNRTIYTSRMITADYGDLFSRMDEESKLIIEKLTPDTGNALLRLSPKVTIQFLLGDKSCEFNAKYLGESTTDPHIGLIVSFPESVKMEERRSYERDTEKIPDFLYAILTLQKGAERTVTYELEIINRSADGVGILVTNNEFDLLEMVEEGDELQDMELYAPSAVVKVTGTVRHKTKLEGPKHKGSYVLGIKLDETLEELDLP
jgi:c-di-GMP-binding flagellar brake protein YcgR